MTSTTGSSLGDGTPLDARALEGLSLIEAALEAETSDGTLHERGELPDEFDGLRIERFLGSGGMGEVYLARQLELDREVAVKVRLARSSSSVDADALFAREARTLASLDHPGIVRVHGVGSVDGRRYLIMEVVRGHTLRELLDRRPQGLSPGAAGLIARGIAEALQAAHAAGVVHRDLKPANVILGRAPGSATRVRLVDFGIAGRAFDAGDRTGAGTARYMAPEQAAARVVGPAADVWSLGAILERMLRGREASGLNAVAARFMHVDPERRPADGAAAATLLASVGQAGVSAVGPAVVARNGPMRAAVAGALVTAAVLLAWRLGAQGADKPRDPSGDAHMAGVGLDERPFDRRGAPGQPMPRPNRQGGLPRQQQPPLGGRFLNPLHPQQLEDARRQDMAAADGIPFAKQFMREFVPHLHERALPMMLRALDDDFYDPRVLAIDGPPELGDYHGPPAPWGVVERVYDNHRPGGNGPQWPLGPGPGHVHVPNAGRAEQPHPAPPR